MMQRTAISPKFGIKTLRSLRGYASAVPSASARKSESSSNPSNWKNKTPLATAQTLTLFSQDPTSLLIALKSTLDGMMLSVKRAGPSPVTSPSPPSTSSSTHDFVLLFALSKTLPSEHLSQAVTLLRTSSPTDKIARLGLLSSSIPISLIPDSSFSEGSKPEVGSDELIHSCSLSLIPSKNAIPFRSIIKGKPQVMVGRWMDKKGSWNQKDDRVNYFDEERKVVKEGVETGWKDLWGKENFDLNLPQELKDVNFECLSTSDPISLFVSSTYNSSVLLPILFQHPHSPSSILSALFFTDPSPQGLLEAFDSKFKNSSILGLNAPPTPFETGRSRTMFSNLPIISSSPSNDTNSSKTSKSEDAIHEEGAIGLVLTSGENKNGEEVRAEGGFKPNVEVDYQGFERLGERREVTSARGNIISSLNNSNATQEFLKDIAKRVKSSEASIKIDESELKEGSQSENARKVANSVKKEEDFYLGIYESRDSQKPILISKIMSGHPTRGNLSIETESDLGPRPGVENDSSSNLWAQFYEKSPSSNFQPLDIPGPDPSVWATPRFLFLSTEDSSSSTPSSNSTSTDTKTKKKQVMALPNMFVAASEKGWIARNNHSPKHGDGGDGGLRNKSQSCNVPIASALLSLRG